MKFLYCIIGFFLICWSLGTIQAQRNERSCWHCLPTEPITSDTINDIRVNGGLEGYIYDISFSQDSQYVATLMQGSPDFPIFVSIYEQLFRTNEENPSDYNYDWLYWSWSQDVTHDDHLAQVAFDPEGQILAIADDTGQVSFWDIKEPSQVHTSKGQSNIREIIYLPNGADVITLEGDTIIALHDMEGNAEYFDLPDSVNSIQSISISADGQWLVVSAGHSFLIYDLNTGTLITQIDIGVSIGTAMFDPNDNHKLFVFSDGIGLWQWSGTPANISHDSTFEALAVEEVDNYLLTDAAISPDGSVLVTIDNQDCIRTWDVLQRQEIETPLSDFSLCRDTIYDIAFSPDGLWLVYGSQGFHAWVIP